MADKKRVIIEGAFGRSGSDFDFPHFRALELEVDENVNCLVSSGFESKGDEFSLVGIYDENGDYHSYELNSNTKIVGHLSIDFMDRPFSIVVEDVNENGRDFRTFFYNHADRSRLRILQSYFEIGGFDFVYRDPLKVRDFYIRQIEKRKK